MVLNAITKTKTERENSRSDKINFVKINRNQVVHKQVEKRDGKIFMRTKKRKIDL